MSDTRDDDRRDARRIPLQTVLRYREIGDSDWCDGRTENISRSGILFRGPNMGEPSAAIEMILTLPDVGTGAGGRALCSGHIVRVVSRDASGVSLAARISSCRIVGRTSSEAADFFEFPTALVGDA
jgi:hypothetical protein